MGEVKRVASLLRVSTTNVEQSESPEAQRLYIQEQIRRNQSDSEPWIDTGLVYADDITGAMVLEREGVKRLLADARAGRFDLLAMKSIQRLGRDTLGLLHLKRQLDDYGIELVALQDGYRSQRDPEVIFLIHADRAQSGRIDISRNVGNAMRQRAKQGKWMAGNYPFGFRRKNRHELEPHPETAPILQEVYRRRRLGWGANRIVEWLNQSQMPAPAWWVAMDRLPKLAALAATDDRYQDQLDTCRRTVDKRPVWTAKTLRSIFDNTAYYGELQYYRRFYRVKLGGRKVLESRPKGDWIVVPCPPLVTRAEWDEAQESIRRSRKSGLKERANAHVYLLTGLLFCGRCGGRMNGGGAQVGNSGWYGYYHCQARRDSRTCDMPSPRSDALEPAVIATLAHLMAAEPTPEIEPAAVSAVVLERVGELEAQLSDLADERRYYRREHRRERLSDADLDVELKRLTVREKSLCAELDRARDEVAAPAFRQQKQTRRGEIADQLAHLVETPEGADRGEARALLQVAVERIEYHGLDSFHIRARF